MLLASVSSSWISDCPISCWWPIIVWPQQHSTKAEVLQLQAFSPLCLRGIPSQRSLQGPQVEQPRSIRELMIHGVAFKQDRRKLVTKYPIPHCSEQLWGKFYTISEAPAGLSLSCPFGWPAIHPGLPPHPCLTSPHLQTLLEIAF